MGQGSELKEWMQRLPDSFEEGGELVFKGRNVLKRFVLDGRPVVAKRYKRYGFLMRLIRAIGHSNKAQSAYDNAHEILRRGFQTPEPLGVVVKKGCVGIKDSYYICAETKRPALGTADVYEKGSIELARAFGRYVAALHQKGILHKDLNRTNVLYEKVGDMYQFELIDVNRMDFYDTKIPDEVCIENLTLFTGRMDLFLTVTESYAEARGWTWQMVDKACVNKLKHDIRWKRKKRLRHPFRKTLALVLLMMMVQLASAQCTTEVRKQDKAAFDKAVESYESKHFVDANAQFKKLTGKNPKSADLYFYLGMIAAKQDVNPAAIKKYFTKTIELCADYPNALAHYYMGVIHYSAEQYEQAVVELNRYFDLANGSGRVDYEAVYEEASSYLHWSRFLAEAELNKAPFEPKLLRGVSSKEDELLPYITWDGKECYYLRMVKEKRPASFYDDQMAPKTLRMMVSRKNGDNFSTGEQMQDPFNINENEGGVSITCDNSLLFYSVVKSTRSGYANCDIYYSEKQGGVWGEIKNAGPQVNGEKSWESQPSISADGQTLYFASNRAGGQGGIDIWKCHRLPNGDWSRAENLGPSINTPGNEKCPFIHADGHTLFFASDGWQGFGGYDMYFANLNDASAAFPTNMGLPINSENDDICLGISADGTKGYFSGKQPGADFVGGKDVYEFELYPAARPEPMKVIPMGVFDMDMNPLKDGRITVKRYGADDAVYQGCAIMLSLKEDNVVVVEAEGFIPDVGYYDSKRVKGYESNANIVWNLRPLKVGEYASLMPMELASDKKTLSSRSKKILDQYVLWLQAHPMVEVQVQSGSLLLSQAICDYLQSRRLRKERLSVGNNVKEDVPSARITIKKL